MNGIGERSCEPITPADLDRLAALAAADREARFTRRPRWSVSGDRIICVALHVTRALRRSSRALQRAPRFARKRASASLGVRRRSGRHASVLEPRSALLLLRGSGST
jgi:hypothetical protein